MPTLTYAELEDLMSSENPDEIWQPDGGSDLCLSQYTRIAGDPKTLGALLKYTGEWVGLKCLKLSSLEEISPAVLMILLRKGIPCEFEMSALKTIDIASAQMLVRAVHICPDPCCFRFGFGFDISNLDAEVIAELFKSPRYGWTEDGQFILFNHGEDVDVV
jgi:hypothetical protein